MLTRGAPQKKVGDTKVFHKEEAKRFHKEDAKEELDNEVEGASSSSRWGPICNLQTIKQGLRGQDVPCNCVGVLRITQACHKSGVGSPLL